MWNAQRQPALCKVKGASNGDFIFLIGYPTSIANSMSEFDPQSEIDWNSITDQFDLSDAQLVELYVLSEAQPGQLHYCTTSH